MLNNYLYGSILWDEACAAGGSDKLLQANNSGKTMLTHKAALFADGSLVTTKDSCSERTASCSVSSAQVEEIMCIFSAKDYKSSIVCYFTDVNLLYCYLIVYCLTNDCFWHLKM